MKRQLHSDGVSPYATPAGLAAFFAPAYESWGVWTLLIAASTAGLWAEKTQMGRELSGALVSMLLALVMLNVGLLPAAAPQYNTVNRFLLPLAVPLLLFSADLRRIIRDTGNLLKCFVIGSVTTVIGTLAAMKLMPLVALGVDSWKVASALCARHIGGAVNFVAVAETLGLSASATAAGLASDNLVSALYFLALYWLGRNIPSESQPDGQLPGAGPADEQASDSSSGGRIAVLEGLTALSISATVCYLGVSVATAIGMPGLSLPIITLLTVALASAAPALLAPFVASAEGLALMLLQMFFAAIGASGSIAAVLQTAPALFGFSLIQIVVHLALLLASGRLLRAPLREVLLASNANVGGPTTAAGMAATKGWKRLVVPSLLVGTLGYAIATFIAVLLGLKVLLPMAAASGCVASA